MYATGALLASRHDPTKDRPAPPHPTPISFPHVPFPPEHLRDWNARTAPDLFQPYSRIRKPSDVSTEHLAILNISSNGRIESTIERLFPTTDDAKAFLAPSSWYQTPTVPASTPPEPTSPPRVLNTGRPYPTRREFSAHVKELSCANEDAYRVLARSTPNGQSPVRLAHYRKFWEALSNAANYWDTSRDKYSPDEHSGEREDDLTKREGVVDEHDRPDGAGNEPRKRSKSTHDSNAQNKDVSLPLGLSPPAPATSSASTPVAKETEPAPGTYRGYRISNGASMPDSYRVDATRAFVEPIAWAYGFTLSGHKRPPVLEIKSMLVPTKLSGAVWRLPLQRDKARAGCLEGPVLGISCRSETGFKPGDAISVLDTLREVGALLCLAQERTRERLTEQKPGAGKWYTSVSRWGGGPGGELGDEGSAEETGKDEVQLALEDIVPEDHDARARHAHRNAGAKRKLAMANAWKTLRVGVGFWDARTKYCAIGKSADSSWDDVYLVSSLNHHISILKLRVHEHYLDYLRTGQCPLVVDSPDWSSPVLSRTEWYDLFDPEARLQVHKILWGVMGYLAR